MTGDDHFINFSIWNSLAGTIVLWDHDGNGEDCSQPIKMASVLKWLETTGWIGCLKLMDGNYHCFKFKDRESKVLFMMAFNVPCI